MPVFIPCNSDDKKRLVKITMALIAVFIDLVIPDQLVSINQFFSAKKAVHHLQCC